MRTIDDLRHAKTRETLSEVIAQYPHELDQDAVGIWQIIPGGRTDFGLSGEELMEYVRRAVYALLDAGAVPVKHVPGTGYEWVHQKQYGSERDEIVAAIMRELAPVPHDSYSLIEHCPWFVRPDPNFPKYVKMD